MKKSYIILKTLIIGCILSVFTSTSYAQFDEVGDVLKSGASEANTLLESYLTPLGKAWGYDLAGGWYNAAATHKTLGFDLTFSINMAQTPDEDMLFDITSLGLSKIQSATANNNFPTITNGTDINSIKIVENMSFTDPNTQITVNGPVELLSATELKGFDIPSGIPLPTLNLGIGLPKGFELIGRFVPNIALGNMGELGLWGIGIKHDILQWLPIVDKVPFLRASFFAGYSSFSMNVDIPYVATADDVSGYTNPENQQLDLGITAFHTAILVGVKIPVLHPYISLGLTSSTFNLGVLGEYALAQPAGIDPVTQTITTALISPDTGQPLVITDPIDLEIATGLKPSFAAGLRIKLAVLTLHGQYTMQEYSMITGGIGISFR